MDRQHFISPDALEKRLGEDGLSIICNLMPMPGTDIDGRQEYNEDRIPGAVYYDVDEISDTSSSLPHMIASEDQFGHQLGSLGVSDTDAIVVYDGAGMFSSARVWWNLRLMGAKDVRILEGGYDRWIGEDRPIDEDAPSTPTKTTFNAKLQRSGVTEINEMIEIVKNGSRTILDARALQRFQGSVEEPRKGLRLGHMPGAISMPFADMIENGTLKNNNDLEKIVNSILQDRAGNKALPIVTSCGSGVTAAVLTLALTSLGYTDLSLFDGSWTQWGDPDKDYPIIS